MSRDYACCSRSNPDSFDSPLHDGQHIQQLFILNAHLFNSLGNVHALQQTQQICKVNFKNTQTSIFVGSNVSDSESTWLFIGATENGFSIIGHNRSMLANRVSYWLNTNGSSYAYVTTETAGLEGITMAYEAIKSGRCVGAVVGTVSLVMHPESLYQHNKMNLLSKDGQCRSFDADCDGFGRSDSCVVLYLQKARDAKRIYATVVHSDKEFFGDRKAGLVRPLDDPLISLLSRFYDKCGIDPSEIAFLEANGCGVKVYDEEEFKAIEKVLLNRRRTPLLVGSVKSNLGHSDAASALCSVAKVLIAMETGYIPPNLNYNKPAPYIPALLDGRIKVMTEKTKWDGGLVALNSIGSTGSYAHTLLRSCTKDKPQDNTPKDGVPRIVCVSGRTEEGITKVIDKVMTEKTKWDGGLVALNSIGSTGSYAHTLLRSCTKDKPQDNTPKDGVPRIVCVSGRTEEGITKVIDKLKSMPVDVEFIRLLHDIHSSNITNHNYRGYILLPIGDTTYTEWKHFNGSVRPVWFVFSGMGSQWVGMGQHLMKLPVLAATLEKCHNILLPFGIDLLHILTTDDSKIFNNILHSFVGIASIQMALVELLKLLNIVPDGLIGHSVGELGCAYADGCFSAEQMILAAYYRGMASLETELINGSMAAIGMKN
uniref:Ketosynthase family 3 (KS3) domain-containing protein n=1 Tax=Timema bartmani TaxID=61472 RepID=A0A7R9EYS4_9NEOP|nr:unnamed protein product [Timema bartmani]